jgi:branched-chain amino acid transport system substrate-binding protein
VKKYGGEVVMVEGVSVGTRDFKTIILKMFERDVDGMVLLGYDEMGILMKQARELGFKGQFYMPGTVTSPGLQSAAGGHAEGTILAFWSAPSDNEQTNKFTQKFVENKGRPPILDLATYPSYDAVYVISLALRNSKDESADEIKKALLNIDSYKGVTGVVSFDQSGAFKIPENPYILVDGRPSKI